MQDFDNMPMRESMREKARENNKYFVKFDDHGLEKRHNKFCNIDRKLIRSIGEDYDNVYSWFCNKYKNDEDFGYLKSYFLNCFVDFYPNGPKYSKYLCQFKLDENKKIQKNPDYKSWNQGSDTRKIIQNIHWAYYKEIINTRKPNSPLEEIEVSESEYSKLDSGWRNKKLKYTIKTVSKNSREWKQYNGSGQYARAKEIRLKNGIHTWEI